MAELEAALRRVATVEDESAIAERLQAPGGLVAVAADLAEGEQLVLVVDQFEELWTLVDSAAERDRFAELLEHAATADRRPCVWSSPCGPTSTTGRSSTRASAGLSVTRRSR